MLNKLVSYKNIYYKKINICHISKYNNFENKLKQNIKITPKIKLNKTKSKTSWPKKS